MKNIIKITLPLLAISMLSSFTYLQSNPRALWAILGDVQFDTPAGADVLTMSITPPTFGEKVLALEGKEITIEGYVIPLDFQGNYIVLSANPYETCFFCGGAGPETVMEVYLKNKKKIKSKMITVKGILELNKGDLEHLTYILKDAVVIEQKD